MGSDRCGWTDGRLAAHDVLKIALAAIRHRLRLPDMTGTELMTKAHRLDAGAKRALLTGWGDRSVGDRLVGRPSSARSTTGA